MAPSVSRYLASVSDQTAVAEVLERLLADPSIYLNSWQELWLLNATPHLGSLSPVLLNWMKSSLAERNPGILRARAALTLSRHDAISADHIVRVFDEVATASKPDAAAALARVAGTGDRRVQAIAAESPIFQWIADWAVAQF